MAGNIFLVPLPEREWYPGVFPGLTPRANVLPPLRGLGVFLLFVKRSCLPQAVWSAVARHRFRRSWALPFRTWRKNALRGQALTSADWWPGKPVAYFAN